MESVHKILYDRLLRNAGISKSEAWWKEFIPQQVFVTLKDIEKAVNRKWSKRFIRLMRNRLEMGYLRYGVTNKRPDLKKYDFVGAIRTKLELYVQTGNTEYLVDIGNYSMLEFKNPNHLNAHFFAGDAIEESHHAKERRVTPRQC